jgi:hypothetical protein
MPRMRRRRARDVFGFIVSVGDFVAGSVVGRREEKVVRIVRLN